jgi:hypothetical protein
LTHSSLHGFARRVLDTILHFVVVLNSSPLLELLFLNKIGSSETL